MKKFVAALVVALSLATPAVIASPEPGMIFVFAADWLNPEGYWILNVTEGCDTEGVGASTGYVRCAYSEPGDSPDPSGAFDPQTAHAPVSILD